METQQQIDICELCEGTGEMANFYHDPESNNYYQDGTVKCICQLNTYSND